MRRIALASIVAVSFTAVSFTAPGLAPRVVPAASAADLHLQDRAFMLYAMELDLDQVELGRLAADKGQDERVRRFAQRMVDYHQRSSERLAEAARRRGVTPPTEMSPLARRTQATLGRLSGPRFDGEYIASQVISAYSAHYGYRREELHGFDRELRREADRQADDMREHRDAAQRIARGLDVPPAGGLHVEDHSFLLYAMHVDLVQGQLSRLATEKAQHEGVRRFARRALEYHERSYDRLAQVARENGVEPLQEVSSVSRGTRERLQRLSGPLFDRQYINAQAFTDYSAFYRYEREAIHGRQGKTRDLAAEASREVKALHDSALAIMREWDRRGS